MGTSFRKATADGRLRLRLATAIALLRVGRDQGLGRHPALLVIDSPGVEEVSDIDLLALLDGLQAIAEETAGRQAIAGSASPASITRVLGGRLSGDLRRAGFGTLSTAKTFHPSSS